MEDNGSVVLISISIFRMVDFSSPFSSSLGKFSSSVSGGSLSELYDASTDATDPTLGENVYYSVFPV
jgi:hypothetical protein